MDPIELGRQHARRLHDEAVQRGRDPWSPYEFAVGIAKDLGIRVETCAPGGALLDGGRASFFPDVPLIVHETKGSLFDQAFLVAHEIGHAELGDGEEEPEPAVNVDPARTSEAAPVGMDRVVDYSRRQRREVQMDLFARELLLPMHVVVDLHVVQGQTCSTIATRLGAPFEVVAQQMLDALLLPAFPVVAATDPVEIPLNKKQETAAAHRGAAFLLQAGPGTGKTRTLVARVESLLDDGVDPRRILLLTFSNRAAGEMAERIAEKRPQQAAALCIGTFHSFGLDILRRFNDRCGLPTDPRLMDRTEAVELLEPEADRIRQLVAIATGRLGRVDLEAIAERGRERQVGEQRGGELGVELADDAGVVAAVLGAKLQDVGDLGVALGAVLAASEAAFTALKLVGAAYLILLGLRAWRDTGVPAAGCVAGPPRGGHYRQGIMVNLGNPKAILFIAALVPQFVDPARPRLPQFLIMAVTLCGIDTLVMSGYALLAARCRAWMNDVRAVRVRNRVFGTLFVGAGLALALSSRD